MWPKGCHFVVSPQMANVMDLKPEAVLRLRGRVQYWAERLSLRPRAVRVQRMIKKWGSCSTSGTVTFAADLAVHEDQFQDVVIVHELLHLRVRHHGKLFRALMGVHVPHWRTTSRGKARRGNAEIASTTGGAVN